MNGYKNGDIRMTLAEQARLTIDKQRSYLFEKYYDRVIELLPVEVNSEIDRIKFIVEYIDKYVFYPLPSEAICRINKNGTVYDVQRDCICEISHSQEYCTVGIRKGSKTVTLALHRALALTFLEIPSGIPIQDLDVNHKDGNKHNYSLDNLEWVTRKENITHALKNDLMYSIPITITYPNKSTEQAFSIEEASRLTGINSSTIYWRLNFKVDTDPINGIEFEYVDDRVVPKDLGIRKTTLGEFTKDGKKLNISNMVQLYNKFPQITRPQHMGIRRSIEVTYPTGEKEIFTSLRKLEDKTGVSRKYVVQWLKQGNGRYVKEGLELKYLGQS